jgi:hypothetical protein
MISYPHSAVPICLLILKNQIYQFARSQQLQMCSPGKTHTALVEILNNRNLSIVGETIFLKNTVLLPKA